MRCPQCQYELRDDAQFCSNCGRRLSRGDGAQDGVQAGEAHAADDVTLVSASRPEPLPSDTSNSNPADRTATDERKMPVAPDTLLGTTLDNRYRLSGHLGRGGMGTVYRARRLSLGDDVAVKVLHRQFVAQPEMLERFRREAQAAAMLRHPNIVTIYDFGDAAHPSSDGEATVPAYIVMELLAGETLGTLLRREKILTPERAVRILREVCAGVGAAHARGIVHRDLKPDNIIVLPPDADALAEEIADGETGARREAIKVVDFGIAKLRDMTGEGSDGATLTHVGTMLGTPSYMSPEQCRGESLDARADVYSLGAIAYQLLTGRAPFSAPTSGGVIAKHLTEPVPPLFLPDAHDSRLASRLDTVIRRALSKEPHERQRDATQFARELTGALRTPQESAAPPAPLFATSAAPRPVEPLRPQGIEAAAPRIAPTLPPKPSKASTVIGLLFVGIAAALLSALVWMLYMGGNSGAASNTSANRNARPRATTTPRVEANVAPTPSPSVEQAGVIAPVPSPSPSDSAMNANLPTPMATPVNQNLPFDPTRTASEVQATLNGWVETTRRGDIERHMNYYAPELENYYLRSRTNNSVVRAERRAAFERFSDIDVRLGNLRITFDSTGKAATATFDKSWRFEGAETSRGAVQQELKLQKINDRWVIIGERDLRQYPDGDAPR